MKKLRIIPALCSMLFLLGACNTSVENPQVAALRAQVASLQSELSELRQDAFLRSDQSLISLENARRSFYEQHYEGMVPESVQTIAGSINSATDAGQPLEKFTAYVYELINTEKGQFLVIDTIERNPDWTPEDIAHDYFINQEVEKQTIPVNSRVSLAIDPHNQLTLVALDENFGKYLSRPEGMEPAAFDFYTCSDIILFMIEAYTPEG